MRTISTSLIAGTAVLALSVLPVEAALAHDHGWGHHGFGPFGIAGAVVGTAAAIVTLPFAVAASVVEPGPGPGYYGPPRGYYGPPPVYSSPGPGYYYGGPGYYRDYGDRYRGQHYEGHHYGGQRYGDRDGYDRGEPGFRR